LYDFFHSTCVLLVLDAKYTKSLDICLTAASLISCGAELMAALWRAHAATATGHGIALAKSEEYFF
jgi:hypothetical protein